MDNDLNTANVLTLANDILKKINTLTRSKEIEAALVEANTLKMIFDILGVELSYEKLSNENKELYLSWNKAKEAKNFEEADKIRLVLSEKGII